MISVENSSVIRFPVHFSYSCYMLYQLCYWIFFFPQRVLYLVQRVVGTSMTNSSSIESIFNYLCVMSGCQLPVLQVQRLLRCLSSEQPHVSMSDTRVLLI